MSSGLSPKVQCTVNDAWIGFAMKEVYTPNRQPMNTVGLWGTELWLTGARGVRDHNLGPFPRSISAMVNRFQGLNDQRGMRGALIGLLHHNSETYGRRRDVLMSS